MGRPQYASAGRFILLTYNLTALYSYNLRKTEVEVEDIAFKRVVSVVIGVVWATLIMHLIWPMEARRQLTEGMSEVLMKLAWLYQQLALSYNGDTREPQAPQPSADSDRSCGDDEESRPLLEFEEGTLLRSRFQPLWVESSRRPLLSI